MCMFINAHFISLRSYFYLFTYIVVYSCLVSCYIICHISDLSDVGQKYNSCWIYLQFQEYMNPAQSSLIGDVRKDYFV